PPRSAGPGTVTTTPPHLVVRPAPWSLPAPLDREVALALGSAIVVMGGNRVGGPTAIVDAIDPRTGTARRLGLLASAEHDAAGGLVAGRPTLVGGGSGVASDTVQALTGGTTTVIGRLPRARADVGGAFSNGVMYVVGGYDGAALVPDVLATTDGTSFRTIARLVVGVRYPACTIR